MGSFAPPLAVFGITNSGLNLVVNLLLLFLAAVWLSLIYWTYADAKRRIGDPMLVGCATAASVFPFIGTIVYMIVRPPEYLEDMRERDLEIAAAEARLAQSDILACPYCDFEIERSFLRCPSCLRRLKEPCTNCGKPLDPRWKICPYCEAEIGAAPAPPRRRARPAAEPASAPAPRTAAADRAAARSAARVSESPAAEAREERPAREPAARKKEGRPASRASSARGRSERQSGSRSGGGGRSARSERSESSGDGDDGGGRSASSRGDKPTTRSES
jgi:uncharacterized membrane protein YgcG